MAASSSTSLWCSAKLPLVLLIFLALFQWFLLAFLLSREGSQSFSLSPLATSLPCSLLERHVQDTVPSASTRMAPETHNATTAQWEGVAVSFMLRRPRWFYKRYNVMIHNAMANTPDTWAIQLFVNQEWFQKELLSYHRGLKRLVDSNASRLVITPLPPDLEKLKPRGILPTKWFWQHVVAEQVLLFHGDGTLCSNTLKTWNDFYQYAYVGVPWSSTALDGVGGAGTEFSLRHKSSMLAALEHSPYKGGPEDKYFVSTLLEMNAAQQKNASHQQAVPYKIAPRHVMEWFAGTSGLIGENNTLKENQEWGPMVLAGTQAHLDDAIRNWVLGTCPELKSIFPALHNPNCFGARPNHEECSYFITGKRPSNGK